MKMTGMKKWIALLLTAMMALSMFGGVALAEEGEEPGYTPVDPYVINYSGRLVEGYEYSQPWLHYSSHRGSMSIRNLNSGNMNSYGTGHKVYNLINTTLITEEGGSGAYASLEAYCSDACIDAQHTVDYKRVNLEDSTFYDNVTAGRLRNIYLNSFPCIKDMSALEHAVNAWLKATKEEGTYAEVSGLTGAEALSATQYSIWEIANEGDVIGHAVYDETAPKSLDYLQDTVALYQTDYIDCTELARETTKNNIEMVREYLHALQPVGPAALAVSEASFANTVISKGVDVDPETGVMTPYVIVSAQVDVDLTNASLTVTAEVDGKYQREEIKADQDTYTFKFENCSAETAKMYIDGYQTVADVFLFVGESREETQSMIAYDDSRLPVHAETIVTPNRVINIHKVTQDNGRTYPLEGIVFDIYYICTVDEYTDNPGAYAVPGALKDGRTPLVTLTTDATGKASVDLTTTCREAGRVSEDGVVLADGIYLVVERDHVAIKKPMDPVLIAVPMTMQDGSGLSYTVNLQPKNEVKPGPGISKDVTSIGSESDSFDIGEGHTWIIRGGVPVDMADGKSYVISDTLDYRLTYAGDNKVAVKVESLDGTQSTTLHKGEHYALYSEEKLQEVQISENESREETIYSFCVELTEAGMEAVAAAIAEGKTYEDYEVRVYFDAMIDEDAGMGEKIENQAALDYENSVGFRFEVESDKPWVYTCGIEIYKHSAKETAEERMPLADARFKLARLATEQEKADGKAEPLVIDGVTQDVVYETFYLDEAYTTQGNCVTTDGQGQGLIYGLKAGTYYLVEIKAPAGYNLLSGPVEVVLNRSSADAAPVRVANSNALRLPATGGIGTVIFTVGGGLLIAAAAVILIMNKKKEKEEDDEE